MGHMRGKRSISFMIPVFAILVLTAFSVNESYLNFLPQAYATEIILHPNGVSPNFDSWVKSVETETKPFLVSTSTGVFDDPHYLDRMSNAKRQTFTFPTADVPDLPGVQIESVTLHAIVMRTGTLESDFVFSFEQGKKKPDIAENKNKHDTPFGEYQLRSEVFENNPLTGESWTIQEVNDWITNGDPFSHCDWEPTLPENAPNETTASLPVNSEYPDELGLDERLCMLHI